MMMCKICGERAESFGKTMVLGKYLVNYYLCQNCGFIQTEEPYWLNEAYSDAIADSDIGLVGRNVLLNKTVTAILSTCFPKCELFLDYGGGYGMFVRLMRDSGFNFEWFDKYCENLFAKSFEKSKEHYNLVTAFELFEHLSNPMEEIRQLILLGDNILFTTLLVPNSVPKVSDWWYYAPHGGQHVSFYTERALQYIAKSFDLHYVGYRDIHLFSKKPIGRWKFSFAIRFASWLNRLKRKKSLLKKDYKMITGMDL
ncbi:MAG: class I SAM-dependent methyltransferase [Lachnoanaerobaculum saburreum]|jgi:hypothetical protein